MQQVTVYRKVNIIQYPENVRKVNLTAKKGHQSQTASLNINLKTLNKSQLLIKQNITPKERQIMVEYFKEKANFSSTRKLFGTQSINQQDQNHKKIRDFLLQFYQSGKMAKRIVQNENMQFKNKLILLKFMQKIRESALKPERHKMWKQKF